MGRKHRQYTDSFTQLKQMGNAQLEIAAFFNGKFAAIEEQQEMIYNAIVKFADHFGVDISEPMPVEVGAAVDQIGYLAAGDEVPVAAGDGLLMPVDVGPNDRLDNYASVLAQAIQDGDDINGKSDA